MILIYTAYFHETMDHAFVLNSFFVVCCCFVDTTSDKKECLQVIISYQPSMASFTKTIIKAGVGACPSRGSTVTVAADLYLGNVNYDHLLCELLCVLQRTYVASV